MVTPINTAINKALKPINVGPTRGVGVEIAVTPNGKTAYVTSGSTAGVVTPIRTATNTALKPITVGSDPGAIAIAAIP